MQVHLIDGTYELFRGWFGSPPAQTKAGVEVAATRFVLRSIASLIKKGTMTHLGVAFDHVIESFRNDLFPGYKTGEGVDPRLFAQFELAERAVAALGVQMWPMVEFEADDAVATAAAVCARDPQVERVVITAVDKDMCQCVEGTRVVCWDRFKDVYLDEAAVIAKHGVRPASIPDWLALVGDTADGIPGLEGWGKSSAGKLLMEYGRIEDIPDDAAKWKTTVRGADKLAASLRANREDAMLYKTLATLRTDCPIDTSRLQWKAVDPEALAAICAELEISVPEL